MSEVYIKCLLPYCAYKLTLHIYSSHSVFATNPMTHYSLPRSSLHFTHPFVLVPRLPLCGVGVLPQLLSERLPEPKVALPRLYACHRNSSRQVSRHTGRCMHGCMCVCVHAKAVISWDFHTDISVMLNYWHSNNSIRRIYVYIHILFKKNKIWKICFVS